MVHNDDHNGSGDKTTMAERTAATTAMAAVMMVERMVVVALMQRMPFSGVFCGFIFGAVSIGSHDGFSAESSGSLFLEKGCNF